MGGLDNAYPVEGYTGARLLTTSYPAGVLNTTTLDTGPTTSNIWGTAYTSTVYGFFYIEIYNLTSQPDTNTYIASEGDAAEFTFTLNSDNYTTVMGYNSGTFPVPEGGFYISADTFNVNAGEASGTTGFAGPGFSLNGFSVAPSGALFSVTQVIPANAAIKTNELGICTWKPPASSTLSSSAPSYSGFFSTLLTNGLYSWIPVFQMIGHD